jgi:ribosomal protein S27E
MNDTIKEPRNEAGFNKQARFHLRGLAEASPSRTNSDGWGCAEPRFASQNLIAPDEDNFRFTCPECDQHLRCHEEHRGTVIFCPTCSAHIRIPNMTGGATLILKHLAPVAPPCPPKLVQRRSWPIVKSNAFERPDGSSQNTPLDLPVQPRQAAVPAPIPDKKAAGQSQGPKNLLSGALWCIGGIVVTIATYAAAEPGGTFIIAWGAILFGGLQFLEGLCQTARDA